MKTVTIYAVIAIVACMGFDALGQQPCPSGGGGQLGGSPYPNYPPVLEVPSFPSAAPTAADFAPPPAVRSPVVPSAPQVAQMRITPIAPPIAGEKVKSNSIPSARVSLATLPPVAAPQATEVVENLPPVDAQEVKETERLHPALSGLVGTWSAVSRFGDGELATVELQLDDRGWAKLTVPGTDGKRSTVKRRVNFEDQELKLTGPEEALSLGKLIDFNDRQMVLEQASGQVTFVRI